MAEQDLDRNHPATAYKLDQARRKGSVARSPDISSVAMLAVVVVACHVMAQPLMQSWAQLSARWWNPAVPMSLDAAHAASLLSSLAVAATELIAPLLLAVAIAAVLSHLLQSGVVLSAEPLKPDFNRLNPAQGFKRLFSLKTVYLAGKSLVKLGLLAGVFWWAFEALLGSFMALSWLPAKAHALRLPSLVGGLLTKLWLVLLVLALIDLMYTRWEFARQMRMSARELKDEFKHREGDPRVRRRLRELRLERLKQTRAMGQVKSADVVVTNPTRITVALRYDRDREAAPVVLAKGAGSLAAQMRELAWRHNVPIVQNPPLARALYRHTAIGGLVPQEWYPMAAKILVWVYAAREARRRGGKA
jgi:flagellar biosynthesis protein FlhB